MLSPLQNILSQVWVAHEAANTSVKILHHNYNYIKTLQHNCKGITVLQT